MAEFLSQRTPTGLMIAQTVGITASAYLLGSNACLSLVAIPAVMQAPAPLAAKQWHTVLTIGGRIGISLAVTSAAALGYVASQQDTSSLPFKLNLVASLLLPSIVPFTFAFIVPINNALTEKMNSMASSSLEDKAVEAGVAETETTHALLDKWATYNIIRALPIAIGTVCAAIAAVHKREVVGFSGVGLRGGANRM